MHAVVRRRRRRVLLELGNVAHGVLDPARAKVDERCVEVLTARHLVARGRKVANNLERTVGPGRCVGEPPLY